MREAKPYANSIFAKISSNWKSNEVAILLQPLGSAKLLQTIGSTKNLVKLTKNFRIAKQFLLLWRKFRQMKGKMQHFAIYFSLIIGHFLFCKLNSNTVAWSPIGRHMIFANPWEPFHPSGLRPLGWNMPPNRRPRNSIAIEFTK